MHVAPNETAVAILSNKTFVLMAIAILKIAEKASFVAKL